MIPLEAMKVVDGPDRWAMDTMDAIEYLDWLPDQCVDLVMFSPPYEKARLYLEDGKDKKIARDTEEWVSWMVDVIRACLRVCKGLVVCVCEGQTKDYRYSGAPVLLWADLIREGICTRKAPVYHRVGIPGSGGPDWWRNDWEFCLCCTNGGRLPWSDPTAIGKPPKYGPGGSLSHRKKDGSRVSGGKAIGGRLNKASTERVVERGRSGEISDCGGIIRKNGKLYRNVEISNPGNLISCGAVGGGHLGSRLAHETEAPYPEKLVEPFVRCFCPPDGIVADPMAGSGTTLSVALQWGRRAIGCDLRPSQKALTIRRMEETLSKLTLSEGNKP